MKRVLIVLLFLFISHSALHAQCGVTINSFPYNESFEANSGNWVSGGVADDWAWGTPGKAIIQTAGNGTKCWITGGLAGSFYNLNERSYLLSPCFDFTNVQYPHIKFKIYWETENQYDGATLQYTINNGVTWNNVGSVNDPVDCLNSNWFNNGGINALNTLASPQQGWSGTSLPTVGSCAGGNGSLGWVTAQHSMPGLGGMPNVQFRFAFGAGSICNNYDGVAVDDINISNANPNIPVSWISVAPNNISCNGGNTGGINALATGGNGIYTYHLAPVNLTNNNGTFNSLVVGTYTVTATDAYGCSVTSSVQLVQPLPILFVSLTAGNLSCFNDGSGQINVQYSGGIGGVNYTVYPTGATSPNGLFTGLNAGTYTIVATDGTGCTNSTTASLTQPPQIFLSLVSATQPGCNPNNDGAIVVSGYGGLGSLTFSNGGVFSADTIFSNLTAGNYTVVVRDATGCTKATVVNLINPNAPDFTSVTSASVSCFGSNDGTINVTASGNAPILFYEVQPGNFTSATGAFNNMIAGIYTIIVSDINSCSNTTVVQISTPEKIVFENLTYTAGKCGSSLDASIYALTQGGAGNKYYLLLPDNITSNDGIFSGIQTAGTYTIMVTDANQCTAISTIKLDERICCDNLIVPTAFSPNNDGKNDELRILNTKGVDIKEFIIYNRWGGIAFKSQNINDSWDGKTIGVENEMGAYYYFIKYICLSTGNEHILKGDVMLVR